MKSKVRNVLTLLFAVSLLVLLPIFLLHVKPIEVTIPEITRAEVVAQEEKQQKEAHATAMRAWTRRLYACEVDEDCIIVDKDPCGCLIGPSGVTAINAEKTLEFNQRFQSTITKACPDEQPSTEKECSESARAVCQSGTCRIVY